MFAQKPPKLIRFGLRRDLLPLIYGVIRRFGLPALSHDCGLGMAPKALCALAAVVLMLTVTSAWCASDAPRNTGVESVRYKESREAEPASGEKDFLASLESAGNAEEQEREAPLYITLLRFGLSLALVLVLAYLTILGLRRSTLLRTPIASGHGRMRLVENLSLGAGRALHLVEVGSKRMVLASTANTVSLVAEVSPEDLPETAPPDAPKGFKDHLAAFLGHKNDTDQSAANVARILRESTVHVWDSVSHLGSIRRRLRDA